ncbi:hypothetical protein C8N43_1978 [Litoreibacter ponti]|uniref:Uncharacterized protein n=1 Tax=Litoreibacter ponti TaxID=1510457 RepID=A0A2T6BMM2_9RHOB|nr:ACT domain-containing protein [Litoreibacter ponti]PTX57311.1 hypothetical protein C8N43_1978 [Litoreibacter ponti]
MTQLKIRTVPGIYAIARLVPDAPLPAWADGAGFVSITRASDELSLVCLADRIPDGIEHDPDWACLRTVGLFAFDATGIVTALITPLSENGIGVFVCCTFDGEHLLVKSRDLPKARTLLAEAGHLIEG